MADTVTVTIGDVPLRADVVTVAPGSSANPSVPNGADVAEGSTTDTAYSDTTGAAAGSLVALAKGLFVSLAARLPTLGPKAGSGSVSVVPNADTQFPVITTPYSLSTSRWSYAAGAGGIVNTTNAVTLSSAQSSARNYITQLQLSWDALTNATEIVLRNGSGGGVLWRDKIVAGAAGSRQITFPVPITTSLTTLLEFATLTASGAGGVYVNAQGFIGT